VVVHSLKTYNRYSEENYISKATLEAGRNRGQKRKSNIRITYKQKHILQKELYAGI
jgi:hypothetical protein